MIRRFLRISRSILEEWTAMFSGRFPPYHKMGIAVALITTAAFSIILSHDVVFEAPVAVIDLDGHADGREPVLSALRAENKAERQNADHQRQC